jgi:hypothetical protein
MRRTLYPRGNNHGTHDLVAPKAGLMILEKKKYLVPAEGGAEVSEIQQQSVKHRLKGALKPLHLSFV